MLKAEGIDFTEIDILSFFITTLLIVFVTDVLKAYFANKIRNHLSHSVLRKINILLGLILIITGIVFIYNVVLIYF